MNEPRNPLDPVLDEGEERTVVIDRSRPAAEPDPDLEERTVVVAGRRAGESIGEGVDAFDRTVVVEGRRAGESIEEGVDAFDRTVVVGRATGGAGSTAAPAAADHDAAAVASDPDDEDRTVVVGDGRAADATVRTGNTPKPTGTRRRRRALTPAPLDPATLRPSVPGRGAGAVETYPTRSVPSQVAPVPVVMDPTPPTRDLAAKPSVTRRARRDAAAGLVAVGASLVVSVGGLIALALVIPSL